MATESQSTTTTTTTESDTARSVTPFDRFLIGFLIVATLFTAFLVSFDIRLSLYNTDLLTTRASEHAAILRDTTAMHTLLAPYDDSWRLEVLSRLRALTDATTDVQGRLADLKAAHDVDRRAPRATQ